MSDETRNNENEQFFDNKDENTNDTQDIYNNDEFITSYQDTTESENTQNADLAQDQVYSDNTKSSVLNSYEWNGNDSKQIYAESNKGSQNSSGKGFRVFLAVMLTVFTASVVALTALFINHAVSYGTRNTDKNFSSNNTNIKEQPSFEYPSVTVENPNYVAFDFEEYNPGQTLSIPEIAAKCSPSSVGIVSEVEVNYNSFFFGSSTGVSEASGSGFIYSSDGYVITNHHVIENAAKVTVILHDNTEYQAEIVGSDSLSDIAVLKITPDKDTTLIPMEIGNSDELVVGEPVVAIGCPAGIEFIGTVTDGIVSSINRNVQITDDYGSLQKTMTLIQTNATINHGNSGGPLINSRGQVIGINTLKLAQNYEGIGFSIPMNGALPIISQLIEHGEVVERSAEDFAYGKGIIGINGSAISEDEAEYYDIPVGVLVVQINKEGSAAKAGLRRGDIITHFNGKQVKTVEDINKQKGNARPGTEVSLTVYRDGDNKNEESVVITFKLDTQE